MKSGIEIIAEEREGHFSREGWNNAGDDGYVNEELASAAVSYALPTFQRKYVSLASMVPITWPWSTFWWKPSPDDRIKELAKAGALIAAEIDRIQRLKEGTEAW